jgi:hypothetical protein
MVIRGRWCAICVDPLASAQGIFAAYVSDGLSILAPLAGMLSLILSAHPYIQCAAWSALARWPSETHCARNPALLRNAPKQYMRY